MKKELQKTKSTYDCSEGIVFEQKELVLGQIARLFGLLTGISLMELTQDNFDIPPMIGQRLTDACAIVLREPGKPPPATEEEFEIFKAKVASNLTFTQMLQVTEDFFTITPISLLQTAVPKILEKGRRMMVLGSTQNQQLTDSSADSPAGMLQNTTG